jgi:hypothetical protein
VRQAEGLRIGNNQGANGAAIFATLSGNRCFNNFQGVLIENNRTNNAYLSVTSSGDRFYENGAGAIILAGLSFGPSAANGNTVDFSARGSRFDDNNEFTIFDVGGLFIVGGENTAFPNGTSNNTVNARLLGCRMSNNQGTDLTGIGARSTSLSAGTPGINNHVTIEVRGAGKSQPFTFLENTIPFEANTTNSAALIQ